MIVFKKLKVKNFLSFGNNDTEIDLENYKLNLVTGSNGAGKSSLLVEGLTYALFGQPFRDIKKGQLINFINDKNSVVELEFSIIPCCCSFSLCSLLSLILSASASAYTNDDKISENTKVPNNIFFIFCLLS